MALGPIILTVDNKFGIANQATSMCACRQKKSFFIEDILKDVSSKHKSYKSLGQEPTLPRACNEDMRVPNIQNRRSSLSENSSQAQVPQLDEKEIKFKITCEVQSELELSNTKLNLEQRRNTYPLYPSPIKANAQWPYGGNETDSYQVDARHRFNYFSDPMLNSDHILRRQLARSGFLPHPFAVRQAFGIDRLTPGCCTPWWGVGGRRKGGQVRFSATQTTALERRFGASKYLSPEERRAFAATLRLSDRQVKTWFQNRRAKWRRTAPDLADAGSPSEEDSDDDVQIAND